MNKTLSISCIDTLFYETSIQALKKTCAILPISKIYWFSDINIDGLVPCPVEWHKIDKINPATFVDFTGEIHLNTMPKVVDTDFNIINHYDGFAVNKEAWTDEFLEYDYIGAVWVGHPAHQNVGNGGFSLRSKKLYNAFLDLNIKVESKHYDQSTIQRYGYMNHGNMVIPEDVLISKVYRPVLEKKYNIKFAPANLADQWSIEHNFSSPWLGKSLGFHGRHGIQKHYGVEF